MKTKTLILALLILVPGFLMAQCDIVINEIMFSPPYAGNNSMHNTLTSTVGDSTAEWVELYNPSSCNSVDISCWILGSDQSSFNGTDYGIFVFPSGTVIPPLGYIVVGGKFAAVKDFDCQSSSQYCGYSRWFLTNSSGWVGLYRKNGTVVNAVYWSMLGASALNTGAEFANSIDSTASLFSGFPGTKKNYTCVCSGTVINQTRAKNMAGIEFAGTSSGALGQGWRRTVDGGSTWLSETPAQSTPKACNGACAQPLAASATSTNPTCGGTGSATASATGGKSPYTFSWSNGQNTATATGLTGGTYTCTVTDACTCQKTVTVSISPAASPFTISVTHTDPNCFGGVGTATASVSGGSGPFTYTWTSSPAQNASTASNLPAGTYTVSASAGGCSASQTVTISQPSQIALTQTTSPSTCGGSNGSATVTASGGTSPYTYSWAPGGGSGATASSLYAGTYTATVTDNKGCTKTVTAVVSNNNTNITVNVTSSPASCTAANGSATASPSGGASPYTYSWSTSPVQTTATANNLAAGTYTVSVTDNNHCLVSQTVTVNSQGGLTLSTNNQNEICGQANGSATVTPSGGTAPFTYTWSTTPAQNSATASGLSAGVYSVTVTDANGCVQTSSVSVSNSTATITVSFSTTPANCAASDGTASANASGGASPYTYSWSTSPNQSTQTATGLAPGVYTVTVTDNNTCTQTATVSVTNQSNFSTTVSGTNETCGQANGSATVTPSGGTAPYNISWNTVPVQNTSTATGLSAGTYTATATDANGCVSSSPIVINNITNISATATQTPATCTAANGSASVTTTAGAAPFSFQWSDGQTAQSISGLASGNYTCVVTDNLGCALTVTVTVGATNPAVLSTIASSPAICTSPVGSSTVTPTSGTAPYNYQWSNGGTSQSISGLSAGTYSVNITDANGCVGTQSGVISVTHPPISLTLNSSPAICTNASGSVSATATGGLVPYSYLWSNGQSGASVTSLAPGVYSVTVTDQNGCDTSGAITVGHVVATLNISSVIKNESCGHSNGSVALNVSGGTTPYAYAWNTGSVLQNSSNLAAGNYYVNVTDANGCAATDTFLLTNVVAISFQSSSTPDHCSNHVGSININPTDGTAPFTYSWSTGAGTQGVAALGAGTYTVTVTDSLGCSSTGTITVDNIDETFNGSISGNNHIDQDEATVLTANIPNGWSFLYWIDDHGDTIKTKNMSLIYPYPDYGTYNMTLYVESASGCLLDIPYSVAVEPSWTFYVPNAMSPDGDGTNDLFFPKFTGVTEVKGWIYDRWGVNCFEFKESGDYWDGYYKGQRAPEDVYVYKFDFTDLKGKKHSINGTVSVIR